MATPLMSSSIRVGHKGLSVRETVIFSMLGALMTVSDLLMEALPNIHLLGLFIAAFTLTYGVKALFPIYIYAVLIGLFGGFGLWWLPYLYIWTVLWGAVMLIPRRLPKIPRYALVHAVTVLHGLAFGTLYAPVQALMWGLDFEGMLAWIVAGFSFDLIHAVGNFAFGFFIYPLTVLLERLTYGKSRYAK